jgi:hypothetical protein
MYEYKNALKCLYVHRTISEFETLQKSESQGKVWGKIYQDFLFMLPLLLSLPGYPLIKKVLKYFLLILNNMLR